MKNDCYCGECILLNPTEKIQRQLKNIGVVADHHCAALNEKVEHNLAWPKLIRPKSCLKKGLKRLSWKD